MVYKNYISVNAILNSLGSLSLSSRRLSEFIIHGPEVTSMLSSMKSSERKNRKKGSRNRVRGRRVWERNYRPKIKKKPQNPGIWNKGIRGFRG